MKWSVITLFGRVMNNNVELCSDWLFHSAAHFSSSHSKQISTVREIQPYIWACIRRRYRFWDAGGVNEARYSLCYVRIRLFFSGLLHARDLHKEVTMVFEAHGRGEQYGKNIISQFFLEISRFMIYHDSLSCWFYYFASCLSITAKLISLLHLHLII